MELNKIKRFHQVHSANQTSLKNMSFKFHKIPQIKQPLSISHDSDRVYIDVVHLVLGVCYQNSYR